LAKLEAKNKRRREERGVVDEPDDGGIEIGGADSDQEGDAEAQQDDIPSGSESEDEDD